MDAMEEKLGAILNNPQLMEQVMAMAQTLNQTTEPGKPQEPQPDNEGSPPAPNLDLSMLQKLSGIARQSGIDREQKALLNALGPYLSRPRIEKLERAMRATKMARMASALIGQGGLSLLSGR